MLAHLAGWNAHTHSGVASKEEVRQKWQKGWGMIAQYSHPLLDPTLVQTHSRLSQPDRKRNGFPDPG